MQGHVLLEKTTREVLGELKYTYRKDGLVDLATVDNGGTVLAQATVSLEQITEFLKGAANG